MNRRGWMKTLLWFCLLGTLQSYLSLYDLIHGGGSWRWQTTWSAIAQHGWGGGWAPEGSHHSVLDVAVDYVLWSLPLLLLLWGLRRHRRMLWFSVALYVLVAMLMVNVGIYSDLVARWSTYTVGELYGAVVLRTLGWWLGGWLGFMCLWFKAWPIGAARAEKASTT